MNLSPKEIVKELDKHIVGQIVTDDVYTEGVRSGYWRK